MGTCRLDLPFPPISSVASSHLAWSHRWRACDAQTYSKAEATRNICHKSLNLLQDRCIQSNPSVQTRQVSPSVYLYVWAQKVSSVDQCHWRILYLSVFRFVTAIASLLPKWNFGYCNLTPNYFWGQILLWWKNWKHCSLCGDSEGLSVDWIGWDLHSCRGFDSSSFYSLPYFDSQLSCQTALYPRGWKYLWVAFLWFACQAKSHTQAKEKGLSQSAMAWNHCQSLCQIHITQNSLSDGYKFS